MIEHSPKKRREIVNREYGDFLLDENKVIGVILKDKKLRPLGDTVLFERDLRREVSESGIILNYHTSQNLEGWVREIGILNPKTKRRRAQININSRCRLTGWTETTREFHYDGKSYLVVDSKDVLFQWN